jgi:N-acetylmuramic acid 6-phosphate etherase
VRENLMINVRPTNIKLVNRAVRIIRQLHDCTEEQAKAALEQSGNDVAKALELLEG